MSQIRCRQVMGGLRRPMFADLATMDPSCIVSQTGLTQLFIETLVLSLKTYSFRCVRYSLIYILITKLNFNLSHHRSQHLAITNSNPSHYL